MRWVSIHVYEILYNTCKCMIYTYTPFTRHIYGYLHYPHNIGIYLLQILVYVLLMKLTSLKCVFLPNLYVFCFEIFVNVWLNLN